MTFLRFAIFVRWVVQPKRHAVNKNYKYADTFKIRAQSEGKLRGVFFYVMSESILPCNSINDNNNNNNNNNNGPIASIKLN